MLGREETPDRSWPSDCTDTHHTVLARAGRARRSATGIVSSRPEIRMDKKFHTTMSPAATRDLTKGQGVCRIIARTSVSHRFVLTPASILSSPERLEEAPGKISSASIRHSMWFTVIRLTRIMTALRDQRLMMEWNLSPNCRRIRCAVWCFSASCFRGCFLP